MIDSLYKTYKTIPQFRHRRKIHPLICIQKENKKAEFDHNISKYLDGYMDQIKRILSFNDSSEEKTKKFRSKLFI
jgi:hypothetical protein